MHAAVVLLQGVEDMLLVLFEDDTVFFSKYEWEPRGFRNVREKRSLKETIKVKERMAPERNENSYEVRLNGQLSG